MSDKDRYVIWKRIALAEFVLLLAGAAAGILYMNYRNGIIPKSFMDILGVLANVGILGLLLTGGGGWIVLAALATEEKK